MTSYKYLTYELLDEGTIARIMLNRPRSRNAQNRGLLVELNDAMLAAVADDHVGSDDGREVGGAVDHRGVLDRAARADLDVRDVAAQHGAEPDVRAVADPDVAHQHGGRSQEDILPDGRRDAV